MKENQKLKYQRYQNQSLMALATANQSEQTKKIIQSQQLFSSDPIPHTNNRIYLFRLPYKTDLSLLVSCLTSRFVNEIIHAEEDQMGAQMMLEGLGCPGVRARMAKILDYCVFCCSKGLRFGRLEESYNVIQITIRKYVIDNQCVISVTNPYSNLNNSLPDLFRHKILFPIQEEIKGVLKAEEHKSYNHIYRNPALNQNSPTRLDIFVHKHVYELFILTENKEYGRFKNLFLHEIGKISDQMTSYRQKISNPNVPPKRLPNPSELTQTFVRQSDVLLQSLKNSYLQEQVQMSHLQPLLCSQTAQTVTRYTIEEVICMYHFGNLCEIYYSSLMDKCEAFNQNMEKINANRSDQECFQHLTLKKKYRLPNEQKPYNSGIIRFRNIEHCNSLREGLLVIQQTFSDVKTDCFVSHSGKVELASMDQLLPVIIFVTVRAGVKNLPIWINLIGDYVRMRTVFQLEERIMTAFYAAIEDVSHGWDKEA